VHYTNNKEGIVNRCCRHRSETKSPPRIDLGSGQNNTIAEFRTECRTRSFRYIFRYRGTDI